jgi:hypothetical protein
MRFTGAASPAHSLTVRPQEAKPSSEPLPCSDGTGSRAGGALDLDLGLEASCAS